MSAQASGAAFDALRHVDGSKRPAAMKFHCPELGSSCHKPCTPNIRRCAALLFVARDPLDVVCDDTQTKCFMQQRGGGARRDERGELRRAEAPGAVLLLLENSAILAAVDIQVAFLIRNLLIRKLDPGSSIS